MFESAKAEIYLSKREAAKKRVLNGRGIHFVLPLRQSKAGEERKAGLRAHADVLVANVLVADVKHDVKHGVLAAAAKAGAGPDGAARTRAPDRGPRA